MTRAPLGPRWHVRAVVPMAGAERLGLFHPLPRGLYRDRRLCRLDPLDRALLLCAHQYSDEMETDGFLDLADWWTLGAQSRIPYDRAEEAVAAMVAAGLVTAESADRFELVGFAGLSREAHERRRAEDRERKRKQREAQK